MATIRNLIVRISVTENTDKGIRKVTTSLRETNRELDKANKGSGRFSGSLSKMGRVGSGTLTGLIKGLTRVVAFSAKAALALVAVGAAAASINTAVQAGAALAPLTGFLALLPGAALGAAAALGTLKLATSGFSNAFAAIKTGNQEKFDKALDQMGPAARRVAKELMALRPAFVSLRNTAQAAVFTPLQGQLTAVTRVLIGPLRQGVAQVGHEFGLAGLSVAQFLRQAETAAVLQKAFAATAGAIHQLVPALQPVLAGFRGLAQVGLSFLPGMAAGASRAATSFGVWLQKIVASGQAAQWISNALATLKQLGTVLSNVGGILKSVFSAASAAGSGFLGVIGAALSQLNAFLKTSAGQSALQSIFTGLAALGKSLGPVIAALVTGIGTLAGPIGRLAGLIGPILTTAINALAPALAALEPGFAAIFLGLGNAVTILAPALVPVANALAQIGVAIGPILPLVARLIAQLATALAPIFGQLVIALGPLLTAIVQLAGAFAPLIPPIATLIVQLVQGLVPAILPLVPVIVQLAQVVGAFLVQALGILLRALIPLLPTIVNLAKTFATQLLPVAVQLSPALLNILTALMPLLPALIQLAPPILQIILATDPLIALLLQFAAVILVHVLPPVVKLATFLTTILAGALTFIAKVVTKITSAVVGAFQWLYDKLVGHSIIPDLVNGITRWFRGLPGKIVGFFTGLPGRIARATSGMFDGLKTAFKGALNWIIRAWNNFHFTLGGYRVNLPFGMGFTIPSITLRTPNLPYLAAGGRIAQAGLAVVGERGPEMVNLPRGAQVFPHGTPRGVAAAAATGRSSAVEIDYERLASVLTVAMRREGVGAAYLDGKEITDNVGRRLGRVADQRRRTG